MSSKILIAIIIEPHMPSRKRLCEIIERNDLFDVWRCLNGNVRQYTWAHSHENLLSLARLDRFITVQNTITVFLRVVKYIQLVFQTTV